MPIINAKIRIFFSPAFLAAARDCDVDPSSPSDRRIMYFCLSSPLIDENISNALFNPLYIAVPPLALSLSIAAISKPLSSVRLCLTTADDVKPIIAQRSLVFI